MKKPIQFGKYYLLDRINIGGMAEVFKAKAFGVEGFERLLAVKRILPNIAEDEEFITMFIDEAKIAVQLNHANVCQIFDLGKVEDSYFIAMEFVHGKDLRAIFDRCKQKPVDGSTAMPIAQACFVVMKACEGLDYAHNKRDAQSHELHLVHRDVSPQNILISYEGEVKLIDFGIAKAAGKASKTQQGILKGKFGYMSPEQVRGLPLDRRSDVFSLGIVLYEMLTGERLFVGESDFSTLEKVRNVEILPPSTYNRRIADDLERIVMKALAKDVDDRYQNAIDLHDDLQAFMYTAGEFYSRKDLAAWMKKVFTTEIESETAKLETYRQMPVPPPPAPAAPPPPPGGPRRPTVMGIGALSPPPPPQPARPSGQHAQVPAARPSGPHAPAGPQRPSGGHPVVASTPAPRANGASAKAGGKSGIDVEWDDEELATNIYDAPQDAEDAVVDDKPDLSNVDLDDSGEPVPHPLAAVPTTRRDSGGMPAARRDSARDSAPMAAAKRDSGGMAAAKRESPRRDSGDLPAAKRDSGGMAAQAKRDSGGMAAARREPVDAEPAELAPLPSQPTHVDKARNGTGPRANPFDFVLPEAPLAPAYPVHSGVVRVARPPSSSSSGMLYALIAGGVLLVGALGGLSWYLMGTKPGEVLITSDPSVGVQVLVDNKRVLDGKGQPIDGTPAPLALPPGSYVVTLQHDGYVPWNEQIEVKAGDHITKRVILEPLASGTGFTLLSEPPGAQAIFDGRALDGVTPLKVESVLPGKHRIEARSSVGSWSQEVTIEAGHMLELHAILGAVAVAPPAGVTAAPPPPVAAPPPPVAAPPAPVAAPPPPVAAVPPPAPKEPVKREHKVVQREPMPPPPPPPEPRPEPVHKVARELPRPPREEPHAKVAPKKAPEDDTPPAPKASTVASGEGYLRLGSKPWTNISVDGKETGLHTPQTKIKLPSGGHRITLTNPQFNIKETFSVDIKPGETQTVIKDLQQQNGTDND